jgi:hypothetical protein
MTNYFNPIREMSEIKNQLSFPKRLGFLFGAGSSMALGLPGIVKLTELVISNLTQEQQSQIILIEEELVSEGIKEPTIEHILNKIRLIRQITKEMDSKSYVNIKGSDAKTLDINICNNIYSALSDKENDAITTQGSNAQYTERFFSWLNTTSRDYNKELFTLNYDMIFERSLENLQLPYFDGFVGAYEPFFCPESVEQSEIRENIPVSWIRIWKLHGSLGWFWKKSTSVTGGKVVRLGSQSKMELDELVIYPSREKYESSRKQPFITYFDRLKHYLRDGEGIFIISGYSFGDEHINDVIFDGLRQNNMLHVIALMYDDSELIAIENDIKKFLNISIFSPKYAIIGGKLGSWKIDSQERIEKEHEISYYWDVKYDELIIGDFLKLIDFITDYKIDVSPSIPKVEVTHED